MPIRKYTSDPELGVEAAQVMTDAYSKVVSALKERGVAIEGSIAGRVARLAIDGERDVEKIVESVLESMLPKI